MLAVILLVLLGGPPQKRTGNDVPERFSFENPSYARTVVARVGDRTITAQEFLLSYAFGPAFPKREKDSKRRYLNYMIDEKLLALDGLARKVDTASEARQMLAEIEGDLATEELYKEDVRSKVRVTEREIRRGMQEEQIADSVQWLFAATDAGARRFRRSIETGTPFDTLFAGQLSDSVTVADRSMQSTRFKVRLKNPSFAVVIDSLRPGGVSDIVRGPDGFYIIKIAGRSTSLIVNESESMKLHEDVERSLVQHKSDSLSDLYVQHVMMRRHPVIVRKSLDRIHVCLAAGILKPAEFSAWGLVDRFRNRWGETVGTDPAPYARDSLVTLPGRTLTVNDFLLWYHAREYNLRLSLTSPQAFFRDLERAVWQMVRDRLLMQAAHRRGLDRRETVRKQRQWWKDKIAYTLVRSMIADSIPDNDSILRQYYEEKKARFRDQSGTVPSFERVREDVRKAYREDRLTERLLHRILALKEKYGVKIADRELENLRIEEENDPRAIDVYMVKPGGTFPHRAFPSIDQSWQSWE